MSRALITGKAQPVSAEDFNARVKALLIGRTDVEKGATFQRQPGFGTNRPSRK
jgi:hypothetical protein